MGCYENEIDIMNALLVFIGGGIGALLRYGIGKWMASFAVSFPLGTLISNISAALILAIVVFVQMPKQSWWSLLLVTGLCGGLSTFSTFSYESVMLWRNGQYAWLFANIALNVIVCIGVIAAMAQMRIK
jgi:CrcB protein